jgi:hypothetical protein
VDVGMTAATAPATASRWMVTDTCSATISEPINAPATVPTLNPAWNLDMIALRRSCSTAAPCTFIATSQVPLPNPMRNSPMATGVTSRVKPTATVARPMARVVAMTATVRASPNRLTTRPDSGMAMTDPTAMHQRSSPSCAGVTSRRSRTWGIRDAQLAKARPLPMNTM